MKKFTIGYIEHNKEVFDRLLGPSIRNLEGDFDVISVTDKKFPAENYNTLVKNAKTPFIILTHQDVTFSPDLLKKIEETMEYLNYDFGALGMVGVDKNRTYRWSEPKIIYDLDTLDCCFLVTKTNNHVYFDQNNFDEYHLYVEDYCAQLSRTKKQSIYTISIQSRESDPKHTYKKTDNTESFLNHHSCTVSERGFCWGRYHEYRYKLEQKWPEIKTT